MATRAENAATALDAAWAALAAWEHEKPSYSIAGRSIEWTAQYNALVANIEKLQEMEGRASGPWQVTSYGI